MIEKSCAFRASDGRIFSSLEEAQKAELALILGGDNMADVVVNNAAKVVDILTTKATSRPRARRVNGGKKGRVTKPADAPQA